AASAASVALLVPIAPPMLLVSPVSRVQSVSLARLRHVRQRGGRTASDAARIAVAARSTAFDDLLGPAAGRRAPIPAWRSRVASPAADFPANVARLPDARRPAFDVPTFDRAGFRPT
ncbi:hypothetical protein, partial [Burkholderia pseudomallei]|uniref:hypothetical protein n=1 Tax=Burkholderia pseudomallei TaxID=28450 RepID=UPI001E282C1D